MKRTGRRTVCLAEPPAIIGSASAVGQKEGDGPLGTSFDIVSEDAWPTRAGEEMRRSFFRAVSICVMSELREEKARSNPASI